MEKIAGNIFSKCVIFSTPLQPIVRSKQVAWISGKYVSRIRANESLKQTSPLGNGCQTETFNFQLKVRPRPWQERIKSTSVT